MKKALHLVVVLSLLSMAASTIQPVQVNPGCPGPKPQNTCLPGTHPVYECYCDGPSGPCHWVQHCVPNQWSALISLRHRPNPLAPPSALDAGGRPGESGLHTTGTHTALEFRFSTRISPSSLPFYLT